MRLLNFFLLSLLRRRGEGLHKIAEKTHYLRRDAFVDDSLHLTDFTDFLEVDIIIIFCFFTLNKC